MNTKPLTWDDLTDDQTRIMQLYMQLDPFGRSLIFDMAKVFKDNASDQGLLESVIARLKHNGQNATELEAMRRAG